MPLPFHVFCIKFIPWRVELERLQGLGLHLTLGSKTANPVTLCLAALETHGGCVSHVPIV